MRTINVSLDVGAHAPTRAHDTDAGMDLYSREDAIVREGGSHIFRTGVHVQLPHGTGGLVVSKSGLNIFSDIITTGLIDEGYTGEVLVKLYNLGDTPYRVKAGDKIAQLVVFDVRYDAPVVVPEIEGGARGNHGFGSTGR